MRSLDWTPQLILESCVNDQLLIKLVSIHLCHGLHLILVTVCMPCPTHTQNHTDSYMYTTLCLIKLESYCFFAKFICPRPLLVRTVAKGHGRKLANRQDVHVCVYVCLWLSTELMAIITVIQDSLFPPTGRFKVDWEFYRN